MDNKINLMIDAITLFPSGLMYMLFNTRLVPVKNKKSYITSALVIIYILYFLEKTGNMPTLTKVILTMFILTGYIIFFSEEKKFRQISYVMLNYTTWVIGEMIMYIANYFMTGKSGLYTLKNNQEVMTILRIYASIIYYFVGNGLCRILKGNTVRTQIEAKNIQWYIPVFVAEFLIPLFLMYQCAFVELNIWAAAICLIIDIIIITMFVITYLFMHESEKRESEYYKTQMLHIQMTEQEKREAELSEQVSKAEDIRTNILDGLVQAQSLLAGEKAKDACSFLGEIVEGLWVGSMYSTNRVVDAVVSAKAKICEEKNIDFECELPIPDDMHKSGIKNAELCAVFANLLDNGIRACDELCDDKRTFIRLYAKERGGYLTIRQENSYDSDRKERKKEGLLPEHGLGLGIIESLATEHEGRLKTQAEDGVYTTRVTLKME